ncbi:MULTISPECIES: phosphoribosylanthranilate isomerase [Acidianus]|uniref:N-(5'-phosphoribosyl)anthranilate isomerase n=1 Tax=Candidatus Acidianus copahuensis TaxID=1160895 RepID=A0A031LP58_9CREN|nr:MULTISPECIES: N-(5'-phosphoribosyl)anthranilate isomerase [Acidianus]EZQ06842.1 N-(5'-phosphoribosyl)anthranilate isomerase [Candidatus Acidianus copahuensis]NON61480.1 N-(5'-phosphoribosyl)anthranilate isomerase [Acidianus sp. RZ1]
MIRFKVCGISTLKDIEELSRTDVDLLGIVTDKISKRYVSSEFLRLASLMSAKPIVEVKVNGNLGEMINGLKYANYLQIHRPLSDKELEELTTIERKRIILYVPVEKDQEVYLNKVTKYSKFILLDSPRKGKVVDLSLLKLWVKNYPWVGIAGGITMENIESFVDLNPAWIDVSSGVEIYPGKKDMEKVKAMLKVVKK